jgi:hypothetical protein
MKIHKLIVLLLLFVILLSGNLWAQDENSTRKFGFGGAVGSSSLGISLRAWPIETIGIQLTGVGNNSGQTGTNYFSGALLKELDKNDFSHFYVLASYGSLNSNSTWSNSTTTFVAGGFGMEWFWAESIGSSLELIYGSSTTSGSNSLNSSGVGANFAIHYYFM